MVGGGERLSYRVVFYRRARGESPVEDFVAKMPVKHQQKLATFLELLADQGPRLERPYASHVRGHLRELRVGFGRDEYRIFHFFVSGERVVLLHAFAKKTQQLPRREIETAEARMIDFQRRLEDGELIP
jgi:phage-related protein